MKSLIFKKPDIRKGRSDILYPQPKKKSVEITTSLTLLVMTIEMRKAEARITTDED